MSTIVRTHSCCGGLARIDGHRLTVIWALDRVADGQSPEEIAAEYGDCPGGVTAPEIREALAWAVEYPEEVAVDRALDAAAWRELYRTPGVIKTATGIYLPPGVVPKGRSKD